MTKVFISPFFRGPDAGEGGIRRVVEAQRRWLPQYGITLVDSHEEAAVIALHAGEWPEGKINPSTPIVAHCHGLYWEGYEWPRWAMRTNYRVIDTMRRADAVTAPSEWVAQALRRGMWIDAVPLHHGIEPEDWLTVVPRGDYVLWNKNRQDAICDPVPMQQLAALAPDVPFISTYGHKASNVQITGTLPYTDAKKLVAEAGVYLATSRETFGVGTLEAMAAAVPVLGWRWGGQAEFVKHLEHGYLAEPGDYDDLLEGLRYCIANSDALGTAARTYVLTNYTNQERVKPYADLYHQLQQKHAAQIRVSVVMPYYNLGKYIDAAVASVVQNQGLKPNEYELIIVDDASPDPVPSQVLAQGAADTANKPSIRVVRNATNQYLAETLNAGIAAARGRYVLPLDADNLLAPNSLKLLADALDDDPSLDIAYGKMEVFSDTDTDGSKRFVSGWPPAEASPGLQMLRRNQVPSTALYRRRVWDRVGGYRRRCHTAEDADFWSRALSAGMHGKRVTDAVTLVYRDRSDSMSRVNQDWDWHKWYSYTLDNKLRLFVAGGDNLPTHEFPLVSVVIPVGPGHARLVLDALDSLQNQTFRHWEVIVVNDTGARLPWAHPWANVLHTAGKEGAATARNLGLDHARGRYVVFLDADDYLHADALKMMYETVLLTGGFVYSDWFSVEEAKVVSPPEFDPDTILTKMFFSVTCMYDRQQLDDLGVRFDTAYNHKGWEDWDFQIQCIAQHGLCGTRIPAPLLHYRYKTGTLRASAYEQRHQMRDEIYAKWDAYRTGEKENMARCGGCGGASLPRTFSTNGHAPATTQANAAEGAVEELEYQIAGDVRSTYVGRITGTRYKFGGDGEHMRRKVFMPDVDGLMATGFFKRVHVASVDVGAEFEPLRAAGPPVREAVIQ